MQPQLYFKIALAVIMIPNFTICAVQRPYTPEDRYRENVTRSNNRFDLTCESILKSTPFPIALIRQIIMPFIASKFTQLTEFTLSQDEYDLKSAQKTGSRLILKEAWLDQKKYTLKLIANCNFNSPDGYRTALICASPTGILSTYQETVFKSRSPLAIEFSRDDSPRLSQRKRFIQFLRLKVRISCVYFDDSEDFICVRYKIKEEVKVAIFRRTLNIIFPFERTDSKTTEKSSLKRKKKKKKKEEKPSLDGMITLFKM